MTRTPVATDVFFAIADPRRRQIIELLSRRRGLAVVLSDFLVDAGTYEAALDRLLGRGHHVLALRVIGPGERDPSALPRQVRLRDAETNRERLLDLTPEYRARYARAVEEHLEKLKRWCMARAVGFAAADTAAGLEACLLADLPRAGVLQ